MSERQLTNRGSLALAGWLSACLRLGWPKDILNELKALWLKHHDDNGKLAESNAKPTDSGKP